MSLLLVIAAFAAGLAAATTVQQADNDDLKVSALLMLEEWEAWQRRNRAS